MLCCAVQEPLVSRQDATACPAISRKEFDLRVDAPRSALPISACCRADREFGRAGAPRLRPCSAPGMPCPRSTINTLLLVRGTPSPPPTRNPASLTVVTEVLSPWSEPVFQAEAKRVNV